MIVELLPLAISLLATGIIAGILAGLLGVGGGIVIVPVLFSVLSFQGVDESVRMHLAVATSMATIVPTSIRSLLSHSKRSAVDWGVLKTWAPGLIIGVLLGAVVAGRADSDVLMIVFAFVALFVALNMAIGSGTWKLGNEMPRGILRAAISGVTGFISTLMGIGGGTLGVPIMSMFGFSAQRAVATASGFGLIISVPATIGFMIAGQGATGQPAGTIGYVNLVGFAFITPMTVLAAPIGVKIAHALPKKRLAQLFGLFLLVTSARMFAGVFF